jgi:hypothetical protein
MTSNVQDGGGKVYPLPAGYERYVPIHPTRKAGK